MDEEGFICQQRVFNYQDRLRALLKAVVAFLRHGSAQNDSAISPTMRNPLADFGTSKHEAE